MEWSYKNRSWKNGVFIEIKNSQTLFCCLYVKLATGQISEQSNKFPLTCSSLKCPPSVEKIVSRKQRWTNFPASQTNSAHKHSQLGSQITEPISASKFTSVRLLMKFTHVIFKIWRKLSICRCTVTLRRISEDFRRSSKSCRKTTQTFPNIF